MILAPRVWRFNHPAVLRLDGPRGCSHLWSKHELTRVSDRRSPHGPACVENEADGGRQAARAGHAKSGGESTPTSLGSETQACLVKPSTL